MAQTELRSARIREILPRTFVLEVGDPATPINLTSIDEVIMNYRYNSYEQRWQQISTADTLGLIAITDATNGEVTLTPNETFYRPGEMEFYFTVVDSGDHYDLPNTDNFIIIVVDGANQ